MSILNLQSVIFKNHSVYFICPGLKPTDIRDFLQPIIRNETDRAEIAHYKVMVCQKNECCCYDCRHNMYDGVHAIITSWERECPHF